MIEKGELQGWLGQVSDWREDLQEKMAEAENGDSESEWDALFWMVDSLQIAIEEVIQEME